MAFHDLENLKEPIDLLSLEVVRHVEKLTTELKEAFYRAVNQGEQ